MRKSILIFISLLFLLGESAHSENHFFVVDGSGSMEGAPIRKAKDAMKKLSGKLFASGDKIAVIVSSGTCGNSITLHSPFMDNSSDFSQVLDNISINGGNSIPDGFRVAQEHMENHAFVGHIYLFGDGDGLNECGGMEAIVRTQGQRNHLTPFTYIGLDWSKEEQQQWTGMMDNIGEEKFSVFDYNAIAKQKRPNNKSFFNKIKHLNRDGSPNGGNNYYSEPWQCIQSDGLTWYSPSKDEQEINYYIELPKGKKVLSESDRVSLTETFINQLNKENVCGCNEWRLPDFNELSRITQLATRQREALFPYIRIWPHISITRGQYKGFVLGINFDNYGTYNYRTDRPYAAMFVSGPIDKNLFFVPKELEETRRIVTPKEQQLNSRSSTGTSKTVPSTPWAPQKATTPIGNSNPQTSTSTTVSSSIRAAKPPSTSTPPSTQNGTLENVIHNFKKKSKKQEQPTSPMNKTLKKGSELDVLTEKLKNF